MASVYTYQDYERAEDTATFLMSAISAHVSSEAYLVALDADEYDRQRNVTIGKYARTLYTMSGVAVEDFTASNMRLSSNFFNRLNTQRVQYSLGNGVSFVQPDEVGEGPDATKEKLGPDFDRNVTEAAYYACIHGVSFVFWNVDRLHVFKLTEFVPLYDETDGTLRAGIRFWRLDEGRPMSVTLFREDGYSQWAEADGRKLVPLGKGGEAADAEVLSAYRTTVAYTEADGSYSIVGEENYGRLPVVPMWASRLKQSTLVGMRSHIDAYDLVKSGFANDLQDCATVYWIVRNANGMTDDELAEFRDRIKFQHIAKVDAVQGSDVTPYTQDVPYQARQALLKELREGIYEDFGALDVHTVAAGATNDHIDAAYQPLDENASDFEYWVGSCILRILELAGIDDRPLFRRARMSNQLEQVQIVSLEAQWLDRETVLQLLPNVRPDQVASIMQRADEEDMGRFAAEEDDAGVAEPAMG